jgi:hypothetical protein
MTRIRLLVLCGLILSTPGASAGEPVDLTPRLSLNVEVVPPAEPGKSPPSLLVSIINQGWSFVWVSRRFAFNYAEAPAAYRDMWLVVRDQASGEIVPFNGEVRVGAASRDWYIALDPGSSVGRVLPLDGIFGFERGHRYDVTVHWHDGGPESGHPPKRREPIFRARPFDGELVSQTVTVRY